MKNPNIDKIYHLLTGALVKAVSGTFVFQIIEVGLNFLSASLISRAVGPSGFGIYSYTIALYSTLCFVTLMGNDKYVMKEISAYRGKNRFDKIQGVVANVYYRVGLLCLVGILVTASVIHFSESIHESLRFTPLALGLILIFLMPLMKVFQGFLQGIEQFILSMIPDRLIRPALFLLFIAGILFLDRFDMTPASAVLAFVLAAIFAQAVIVLMWQKHKPYKSPNARVRIQFFGGWKEAFPFAILAGLTMLTTNIDILMLGSLSTNQEVGIYRIAGRVAMLIGFPAIAVFTVISPIISKYFIEKKFKDLQSIVSKGAFGMAVLALPIFIAFIFTGNWILRLFGEGFDLGYSTLIILSAGQMLHAFAGLASILLQMTDYVKLAATGLLIGVVFNVVLNAILIPEYGSEGAAYATTLAFVLTNLLEIIWVWQRLRINPTPIPFPAKRRSKAD